MGGVDTDDWDSSVYNTPSQGHPSLAPVAGYPSADHDSASVHTLAESAFPQHVYATIDSDYYGAGQGKKRRTYASCSSFDRARSTVRR